MNNIKQVLKKKGLSQRWLCRMVDRRPNIINGYCQNVTQPSLKMLWAIAEVLDVEPKSLIMSRKEYKSKTPSNGAVN